MFMVHFVIKYISANTRLLSTFLILKSPVGVKELFFLFLCDLQAELDVKLPGEDGGRDRVFKVSICCDICHIQDIVYNN